MEARIRAGVGVVRRKRLIRRKAAFTILETLVAIAVFILILVIVLQIFNGVLGATHMVNQQMDSTESARKALDTLAIDIRNAVSGDGVYILVESGPKLAFATRGRGPKGTSQRFLGVDYELGTNQQLLRYYKPISWASPDVLTQIIDSQNGTKSVLARGVLAVSFQVILENGAFLPLSPTSGPNIVATNINGVAISAPWSALCPPSNFSDGAGPRAHSLLVTLAMVDDQNFDLLNSTGNLAPLCSALSQPGAGENVSIKWGAALNSITIPQPARAAIRFVSKSIALP